MLVIPTVDGEITIVQFNFHFNSKFNFKFNFHFNSKFNFHFNSKFNFKFNYQNLSKLFINRP